MSVYAYQYTCEVCGDQKTTMTDFKNWRPPDQLSCETESCWGPMRVGPYTGVRSENIIDRHKKIWCEDCGTTEAPGWFKKGDLLICPACQLKRHPDRAREVGDGEETKGEEASTT